jgi:CRP-like cAMP-binding protein
MTIWSRARRGEFFTEDALFAEIYHCDVADAPSLASVPKAKVMEALRADPELAGALMAQLANQLRDLRARMELPNICSARERVLQYLRLRAGQGQQHPI